MTWLIRVPSCHPDFYDGTVNALQQFMESDCENLIIDIRFNGGGGDNVWEKYYDLLYDHPGKPEISWHRNTPKNLLYWKDVLELLNGYVESDQIRDIDHYIVPATLNDNQAVMGCLKLAYDAALLA